MRQESSTRNSCSFLSSSIAFISIRQVPRVVSLPFNSIAIHMFSKHSKSTQYTVARLTDAKCFFFSLSIISFVVDSLSLELEPQVFTFRKFAIYCRVVD